MLIGSSEHAHNKVSGEAGESRDPGRGESTFLKYACQFLNK